jgi:hypothetical protein
MDRGFTVFPLPFIFNYRSDTIWKVVCKSTELKACDVYIVSVL